MTLDPNTQQPVTPDQMLRVIASDLRAWPRIADYTVRACEDAADALGLLCDGDSGGRIILRWAGDQAYGGAVPHGDIAVSRLSVVMTRGQSLSVEPGQTELAGDFPFLAALAALRARILSYRIIGDATEGFFRYVGSAPVSLPDGLPIRAYEITFSIRLALPVDARNPVVLAL